MCCWGFSLGLLLLAKTGFRRWLKEPFHGGCPLYGGGYLRPEQSSPWKWSKQLGARVVAAVKHTKYIELCKLHGARFFFCSCHRIISTASSPYTIHCIMSNHLQLNDAQRWGEESGSSQSSWNKVIAESQGDPNGAASTHGRSIAYCYENLWATEWGQNQRFFILFLSFCPWPGYPFFILFYPPLIFPQFWKSFFYPFLILFLSFFYWPGYPFFILPWFFLNFGYPFLSFFILFVTFFYPFFILLAAKWIKIGFPRYKRQRAEEKCRVLSFFILFYPPSCKMDQNWLLTTSYY